MSAKLTWLTVGGCARSGTTALGEALRKSRSIQLFYEVQSHIFFECVNGLFFDERRLRTFQGLDVYSHPIPLAERDAVPIIQGIFEAMFRERAPVVGTKLPNFYLLPQSTMLPGIAEKTVMISRNPYDVVLSGALKRQEVGYSEALATGAESVLMEWIRGWNHAVLRHGDEDFFHIFYHDLDGVQNGRIARELARFLGIEPDFDLASMRPRQRADIAERYAEAELDHIFDRISRLFVCDAWPEQARHCLKNRIMVGMPLGDGEVIDFTTAGNSSHYVQSGFYPPEHDGSWTMGGRAVLAFRPARPLAGDVTCLLDVKWALPDENEARIATIRVNGQDMARQDFSLGEEDGIGRRFTLDFHDIKPTPGPVILEICVENPRSPRALGLSDDNRSLGMMVQRLSLE